jgi:hypothetical protein
MDNKISKTKFLIPVFFLLTILLLSTASAIEINPFATKQIHNLKINADVNDFLKEDFNSKYGTIRLSKSIFWFESDKLAEYSLTKNTEQCLIDCSAEGKAVLYSDGKLFEDLYFLNKKGSRTDVEAKYLIKENGEWVDYQGQILKAGNYEWKIEGKKKPNQAVDFIPVVRGKSLDEWAWWDSDWNFKKEVSNLTGNISVFIVDYDANMNADFSDLIFVDSSETIELNYTIENKVNESYALVRLQNLNFNISYMYFRNIFVSSTSNAYNTYFKPVSVYYIDEGTGTSTKDQIGSLYNGTISGGGGWNLTEYYINQSYRFVDTEILMSGSTQLGYQPSLTYTMWVYPTLPSCSTNYDTLVMAGAQVTSLLMDFVGATCQLRTYFPAGGGQTLSGYNLIPNTWNFVAITHQQGGNTIIYANGVVRLTDAGNSWTTTDYVSFGRSDSGTEYYTGLMDEIRIYNRTLDVNELNQLWTEKEVNAVFGANEQGIGTSVSLTNPEDNFESNSQTIIFNATITPLNVNITNVTFYAGTQTSFQTFFTNNSLDVNWTATFSDGTYSWNVTSCWESDSEDGCDISATRTFEIDSTYPQINFSAPTGNIPYHILGNNLTVNWSVADTNLDACKVIYNNVNYSVSCSANNFSFTPVNSVNNISLWANDTIGNEVTNYTSWTYKIFQNNVTYNNNVLETSTESISLNITTLENDIPSSALLIYNGTPYNALVSISGGNYIISKSIDIPTVEISRNQSFYFNVTVDGTTIQTPNYNQSIININFSSCATTNNLVYNFTTYDSQSSEILNASLEATFEFYATTGDGTETEIYNFESINESKSSWLFCLDSAGINVTIDATISFYADEYDRREYIIQEQTIYSNLSQEIGLYLDSTSNTDVVTITVSDQNYNPIENALVSVQEWNIGTNTYSTIGMFTTNSEGEGIINLELFNIWYRAIVTYNGEIVKVTDPQKIASTSWPITIQLDVDNPYELFGTISHGLTFSNLTNITTFTWIDSEDNTQTGCLQIRNLTNLGYKNISTECVSSSAGIIVFQFTANGEYEAIGKLYLIPTYNKTDIPDVLHIRIGEVALTSTVKQYGRVIALIMIGTFYTISVSLGNPILGIVLFLAGIYVSGKLGFLAITMSVLWGLLVLCLVIASRLKKK